MFKLLFSKIIYLKTKFVAFGRGCVRIVIAGFSSVDFERFSVAPIWTQLAWHSLWSQCRFFQDNERNGF